MNLKKNNYYKDTGIQIFTPAISGRGEFLNPIIKTFALICAVMSICEAISAAFSVYYDRKTIFYIVILLSFVLSVLDFSKPIKFASVLSALCVYAQYAYLYKDTIKSGFYGFANVAYDVIRKRYAFPLVDGFPESNPNRTFTVTVMVIFLAILLTIILDFIMTGFISVLISMLFTFILFQTSIFFGTHVESTVYIMLFASWLTSIFLAFNGKFKMRRSKIKKRRFGFYYKHEKRGAEIFAALVILGIFFSVGFLLSGYVYNKISYKIPENNEYKYTADTKVRDAMILWFAKYKKYDTTYRISRGQMGNYGYMTGTSDSDSISVTLSPFSEEPFYLKSFTGADYYENEWHENEDSESVQYINITANALKEVYEQDLDNCIMAKVSIKSLNENDTFSYIPYNAVIDASQGLNIVSDSRVDSENSETVDFYVYSVIEEEAFNEAVDEEIEKQKEEKKAELEAQGIDADALGDEIYEEIENERPVYEPVVLNIDDDEYYSYACEHYLNVPEENKDVFDEICLENNITGETLNLNDVICDYFKNNYTFSANTGLVPWQTDFVNYFVTETKSGNMTHFASAAVLLYRSLGVPARYAEGYVVTPDDYDNADVVNEDSSDRIFGAETDEDVVNMNLSAKSSFAWVEVYEKGYGWKAVNVTPVDLESDEYKEIRSDNEIVNFELIKPSEQDNDASEEEQISGGFEFSGLFLILFEIIAALLVVILISKAVFMFFSLNKFDRLKNINARLDLLFNIVNKKMKINGNLSFKEYAEIISSSDKIKLSYDDVLKIFTSAERFSYSKESMEKREYIKLKNELNKLILIYLAVFCRN